MQLRISVLANHTFRLQFRPDRHWAPDFSYAVDPNGADSPEERQPAADADAVDGSELAAVRIPASTAAAEDVVHDAFIIAFGRLRQLAEPSQFRGWLVTIVVSLVRRRLRRERLLRFVGLDSEPEVTLERFARPGTSVEACGELALLDDTLRALPSNLRLAWSLRHVEGEKLEDVATLLNKSLSTTKRYLAEAEARISKRVSMAPLEDVS
jgi:RNA polymerase sigma-70 factor (ECF subfamily)